jgi:hypothetical protein
MMTEEFVDDEKHELTEKFAEDMLLLTKAALDRGACPLCVARSFTDTAAGIAELVVGLDPGDYLEREAARIRAELNEPEPTIQ